MNLAKHRFILATVALLCAALPATVSATAGTEAQQESYPVDESKLMPTPRVEKRIQVVLSVYSGRPNPNWILTEGPDFEKVLELVKALEVSDERLFDYDEWNRLGYASFWVHLGESEGAPRAVHVWRDMAYVVRDADGAPGYSIGATELYDLLVEQAEGQEQGVFFRNYRKEQEGDKGGR